MNTDPQVSVNYLLALGWGGVYYKCYVHSTLNSLISMQKFVLQINQVGCFTSGIQF